MVKIHILKCSPEFFMDVFERRKNFEIRINDRNFQAGDAIRLMEYSLEGGYTNSWCERQITYVTNFPAGLREGYVCMGIQ